MGCEHHTSELYTMKERLNVLFVNAMHAYASSS